MGHLVKSFCIFEISGKFPSIKSIHFLKDLPVWVDFGLIWAIFTVFGNFGQKMDHLVNLSSIFEISKKLPTAL